MFRRLTEAELDEEDCVEMEGSMGGAIEIGEVELPVERRASELRFIVSSNCSA